MSEWALVTGAAGGIGRAFAESLAALGYDLVLVDIAEERLSEVAAELRAIYGVEVRSLVLDLSQPSAASRVFDFCVSGSAMPEVVINNAGIFSYNDIATTQPEQIERMLGLHVVTLSLICRLFTPKYFLNMSSYSAWMPWPGIATYSASKSYIRSFSLALADELRREGIFVTTVLPAGVTTGLYGLSEGLQVVGRRLGLLLTPEQVARKSLRAMFRGRRQYIPGVFMRLVLPLVRIIPQCAVRFVRLKTLKYQR